jgi:hypothetical protein
MNIDEFADIIMSDIVLRRYCNQSNRWTARFEGAEVKEEKSSVMLTGEYGNAKTPQGAIADYVENIKGKILIFNAMSKKDRREYGVPTDLKMEA